MSETRTERPNWTPDERWILDAIHHAEDRLFEKIDFYASKNGLTPDSVVALLDRAFESDLSEKYSNWVAEGEDETPTVLLSGVAWPVHQFVAKKHVKDGLCHRCGCPAGHEVHGTAS